MSVNWVPVWSKPAALRALRAVLVVPPLFALTYKGFGNLQIALFATFGGFASLVMASFGGTRRDKAIAHLGLAVIGSVALIIGTVVNGNALVAAVVTLPVAGAIFFAGVAGPNAAGGVNAALLAYVLPVASPGNASMIPDRLAGWWLASAISTAAVLLSPRAPGDRLRASAAGLARALSAQLSAAAAGDADGKLRAATSAAKQQLLTVFASTPYRPTGLATADQGLASVVQLLEWCTALVFDAADEDPRFTEVTDCQLIAAAAALLADTAALLDPAAACPDRAEMDVRVKEMERLRETCAVPRQRDSTAEAVAGARRAFHVQVIAVTVRAITADALIATRRADPETVAEQRRLWYGAPPAGGTEAERRVASLSGAIAALTRHASLRSVWTLNALRGSAALAAAVLVADLSGVQHAFWVVLGTMSVLRSNAASTEATALRALGGTVIGFVIGALLLAGIGTSQPALWAALPVAVAIAAYAPAVLPFLAGQAAFTITVVVLFNLLVPAGWKVGLLRIEDVAMGCVVSLVVGLLFWPRGAGAIVGDDLADSYRAGSVYLTQAVDWALGLRLSPPDAAPAAITAGIRLDEGLRGFLAEQGAKRISKEDLWRLVMASTRLRLTAYSVAALHTPGQQHAGPELDAARAALARRAGQLADFYERVAVLVGRPVAAQLLTPVEIPQFDGLEQHHPRILWVREHLHHLGSHAAAVLDPAGRVAEQRRLPWWR